jgi:hypothetical protein
MYYGKDVVGMEPDCMLTLMAQDIEEKLVLPCRISKSS